MVFFLFLGRSSDEFARCGGCCKEEHNHSMAPRAPMLSSIRAAARAPRGFGAGSIVQLGKVVLAIALCFTAPAAVHGFHQVRSLSGAPVTRAPRGAAHPTPPNLPSVALRSTRGRPRAVCGMQAQLDPSDLGDTAVITLRHAAQ